MNLTTATQVTPAPVTEATIIKILRNHRIRSLSSPATTRKAPSILLGIAAASLLVIVAAAVIMETNEANQEPSLLAILGPAGLAGTGEGTIRPRGSQPQTAQRNGGTLNSCTIVISNHIGSQKPQQSKVSSRCKT